MRRLLPLACVVFVGCSFLHSTTSRTVTTNPANGVVTVVETTSARGVTVFDAQAALAKFYNRSGYVTNHSGTFAPGTYAAGVNESSSASNVVAILQAIATGVAAGLK